MTIQQYNQWVNEQNRRIKQHNDEVKRNAQRAVDSYNREVDRVNGENERARQQYNNKVRQFNSDHEAQRRKINTAIQQFNDSSRITTSTSVHYKVSVQIFRDSYTELENYNDRNNIRNSSLMIDYPGQEISNSVQLYNSLSGTDVGDQLNPATLQVSAVEQKLYALSTELGKRWQGALYSLHPTNPDAARHFCTSIREIFIQLIDLKAPDQKVLSLYPDATLYQGRPARRHKIEYMLSANSIISQPLVKFVDSDVKDLLELFRTLNDGTHGNAGSFTIQQLLKLKKRAEDSILFVTAF